MKKDDTTITSLPSAGSFHANHMIQYVVVATKLARYDDAACILLGAAADAPHTAAPGSLLAACRH